MHRHGRRSLARRDLGTSSDGDCWLGSKGQRWNLLAAANLDANPRGQRARAGAANIVGEKLIHNGAKGG